MITCWLYRNFVSSRMGVASSLPHWAQRHVQHCSICRETHRAATAVTRALAAGPAGERRPLPPFLHAKIMGAVRAETSSGLELRRPRRLAYGPLAVGLACLVLLAGTVWIWRPRTPAEQAQVVSRTPEELHFKVQLPSLAQVNQWTSSLDEPLENETQLVLNDAKTALTSLKNSFLPEPEKGAQNRQN